ncbi:2-dehydropantoate 2-reductase N-terminal domain-containing protein [Nocardioides maradonensis]
MRYVVVGLGAIGGTIAARLSLAGQEVHGIARGAHLDAVRADGLLLRSPAGRDVARFPASTLDEYGYAHGDAIVLAVKSQDTQGVLAELAGVVPDSTPVLCAQNGVSNEPAARRWFAKVLGVVVQCPAVHLRPGVVDVYSSPVPGVLDLGLHGGGEDDLTRAVAADWSAAGFASISVPDIDAWKHAKLLGNLFNAIEVVCGTGDDAAALGERVRAEAREVLDRARIAYRTAPEERARVREHLRFGEVDGPRPGSSMWQSVNRGQQVEADFLNGEIVRLARAVGADAPLNRALQRLAREVASGRRALGETPAAEVG